MGVAGAGEVDSATTRIVSLVPGLTETCFAIGAGDQVVGDSDYCFYPAEAKARPHVGGLGNPRLEQLILLEPTIVLLYRSQADFAEKLHTLNIQSRLFAIDTLADVYASTHELGTITGHISQSVQLVKQMQTELKAIQDSNADTTAIRTLVLVSRDPTSLQNLYQAGPHNFLGEILRVAGGVHAIPAGATITKEQIILGNPEVIIDLSGGESVATSGAAKGATELWKQLNTIDAVKHARIYYPSNPHALVPGPYLTHVAAGFDHLLHTAN